MQSLIGTLVRRWFAPFCRIHLLTPNYTCRLCAGHEWFACPYLDDHGRWSWCFLVLQGSNGSIRAWLFLFLFLSCVRVYSLCFLLLFHRWAISTRTKSPWLHNSPASRTFSSTSTQFYTARSRRPIAWTCSSASGGYCCNLSASFHQRRSTLCVISLDWNFNILTFFFLL